MLDIFIRINTPVRYLILARIIYYFNFDPFSKHVILYVDSVKRIIALDVAMLRGGPLVRLRASLYCDE